MALSVTTVRSVFIYFLLHMVKVVVTVYDISIVHQ